MKFLKYYLKLWISKPSYILQKHKDEILETVRNPITKEMLVKVTQQR